MIDPRNLDLIINDVLKHLGEKNKVYQALIKITFYEESICEKLVTKNDFDRVSHVGFMMLPVGELRSLITNELRHRPNVVEEINNIALVDVKHDSIDDIILNTITNISLQVIFTYYYYLYRCGVSHLPSDLETVASTYLHSYAQYTTPKHSIINNYNKIFKDQHGGIIQL